MRQYSWWPVSYMPSPDVHLPYVRCLLFYPYRKIHNQKTLEFRVKQDKFHLHMALCKTQRRLVDLGRKWWRCWKGTHWKVFPFDIRENNSILEYSVNPEEKKICDSAMSWRPVCGIYSQGYCPSIGSMDLRIGGNASLHFLSTSKEGKFFLDNSHYCVSVLGLVCASVYFWYFAALVFTMHLVIW